MLMTGGKDKRRTLRMIYADELILRIVHGFVKKTLGKDREINAIRVVQEAEIRELWVREPFDGAFLLLNNIMVPDASDPETRIRRVLALVRWMFVRSSAPIVTFCGYDVPGIEEAAIQSGADAFFHLPFEPEDLTRFLRRELR
jgi:hypothetical protein